MHVMSMKINRLEIENTKRVKAVKLEPAANGLTVIGGKNGQGKTSVLDAIAWALGGDRYRPSQPQRAGSVLPPTIHIVMNNGLVVERKGKNSSLVVTDPSSKRAGQQLLNSFVEELALNLPRFMQASSREKAETLLKIIGVGDKLRDLETQEQHAYNRRHAIGQIADQKEKFAKEQPYYPDAPKDPVSASELIRQQQDILARNGRNEQLRRDREALEKKYEQQNAAVAHLRRQLEDAERELGNIGVMLETARCDAKDLRDESTAELERSISEVDEINRKVRANLDKEKAEDDAKEYRAQYQTLTLELGEIRKQKATLLQNARLPLEGLSVDDGELTYHGFKWDNLSGSDQLRVATAIVRALNPQCGFVLLDKLEQMDEDTLKEFGDWLAQEGLQAIATRVSTGGECQIIIEDGYGGIDELTPAAPQAWEEGKF